MKLSERTQAQYRGTGDSILCERPPLPRNMMVELSNACNHRCVFCPNPHMRRGRGRIEDGLIRRVLSEAAAAGVREVGFYTTGEPFIHTGLADLTAHAKSAGFEYIYISTNGGLASPERSKPVIDAGMNSIKFSINAGSRETYRQIHGRDDFDTVCANLRFMSEYRRERSLDLKLFITCVVTKLMEHEVESMRATFGPLVDEICFDPCTPLALPDQVQHGNPTTCTMPFNRLHVTHEGYLTLCCVDFQNYLAVADLNQMSVTEGWTSPQFVEMRRRHLEDRLSGTLCGRCWHGDPAPVTPVTLELADAVDFEEYDRTQRQAIMNNLRTNTK